MNVVVGRDPFDYRKIWDDMYLHCNFYGNHGAAIQAMSGIDIAIWDILGKALNKPIWQLLGGKYRDKVRCYASVLMPYTEAEAKERVKDILIRHFGGYTIQEAQGGWIDDGKTYQEYTLMIYLSDTTLDKVHAAADEMVETFRQSSVLIQENPTKTEFYSPAH